MSTSAANLRTFRHGVHPPEHKEATEALPIERMPWVDTYVLPLSQHIGKPAKPVVAAGARVRRGQMIAAADGFISTALHAPVTGRVTGIELRLHPNGKMMPAIVIAADPWDDQRPLAAAPVDPATLSVDEIVRRVQEAGIVGLGGAAFPSHVKLKVPTDKKVDVIVANGCECEPYLTCDHRQMVEQPERLLRGMRLLMRQTGAKRGVVGVERNKPDAVAALRAVAPPDVEIVALEVKYPQGAEKMLIDAIFAKQVPDGGLPLDLEMVVNNVGTMVALADLFDEGLPLTERVVTVTGPGIGLPRNLRVPLGTPVSALIAHCGGLLPGTTQVVLGGPMMGMAQKSLEVPVLKGTSGVLALTGDPVTTAREHPCIRCGRCVEACPLFLQPWRLAQYARAERPEQLTENHLMSCFECASCSFVCPSNIPLVQWMRMGKGMVRQWKAKS